MAIKRKIALSQLSGSLTLGTHHFKSLFDLGVGCGVICRGALTPAAAFPEKSRPRAERSVTNM